MELTRRDAMAALAAGGAAGVGAVGVESPSADDPLGAHERATLVAIARVVYPSAVSGIEEFVRTYSHGRIADRPAYAEGVAAAVATLDRLGRQWHGARCVDLDPEARERLLREVGADVADPDPSGSPAERVRYYVVNELLYALYTSPAGGDLVGIENPQGHPGGVDGYRRGPRR